ncbi:MAG: electron transport complex subunit RsxC [Pseudomonadota bacterium]
MPDLFDFPGGLHLNDQKSLSNQTPIQPGPLPAQLWVPLQQHVGAPAEPVVQPGDLVKKGQLIARATDTISAAVHAPTSGVLQAIADYPIAHASGLPAPCMVIQADGQDIWGELPPSVRDYIGTDPDILRERIRSAGIVGLGGALFPTSVKAQTESRLYTLIINAVECEPYITCDDRLMREQAADIIAGVDILRTLIRPERTLIGVEDNKPEALAALQAALAEHPQITLRSVPTRYPSGGEKQLIQVLTGQSVPSQGLPLEIGVLCQNVATCVAIADAVLRGRPLISRIVTLTGQGVAQPGNYRTLIGTRVDELITHAGGYAAGAQRLVLGGPMMGESLAHDQVPVTKGSNCFIIGTTEELPEPRPAQPCIRCGACVPVCPANLLPQQLYWHARAHDLEKAQDYHLFDCIECGCCAQVCPAQIPLVDYYRYAKAEITSAQREQVKADRARERHEARQQRLARQKAERQAKMRRKQEALKNQAASSDDPQQAAIAAAMARVAARKAQQQTVD